MSSHEGSNAVMCVFTYHFSFIFSFRWLETRTEATEEFFPL